jgi:hypothetical protein
LAGVLRLEGSHLQIIDDEAAQPKMIEEEVEIEVLSADFQVILAADEGKADPEFQEKLAKVIQKPSLQIPFLRLVRQRQEIERFQDKGMFVIGSLGTETR